MARSRGGLGLVCFAILVAAASATQFRVGGQRCWTVPDANAEPYNAWAGRMRFQIGDQLLFVYPKEMDSVLLVDPAAYSACNTSSYISKFDDGNTVFTLDRSGPFFFISGNEGSCRANQKLIVVVLADRSGTCTPPGPPNMPPPSSAPLPSPSTPPAAAPVLTPPPSAAPMPTPTSPEAPSPSTPPAAAPVLTPPPSAAPMPTPTSPAPAMPAPATTPTSAPSPAGMAPAPAPATTPASSPPSPGAMAPSPSTPGAVPTPPSGSANAPGGSTTTPTPPSVNDQSGASSVVAGFVASLGAYIGYAVLAI